MRRRTLLQGLAATAATTLAAPAVAQPGNTRTLRFVPQSNLPTLDPMFSSEVVANHGFTVFDPTDNPPLNPLGKVTADLLRRIGMKADLANSDSVGGTARNPRR